VNIDHREFGRESLRRGDGVDEDRSTSSLETDGKVLGVGDEIVSFAGRLRTELSKACVGFGDFTEDVSELGRSHEPARH
jgi:hypothetical protein